MSASGPKADLKQRIFDVGSSLNNGHSSGRRAGPLCANNRHLRLEEVELGCILNYFHTAVPLCATVLKKSLTAVHL
jgi:hypothetical protein